MKVKVPRRKTRIEMLPLIDIVFLLLVVFIYAMLSMAVHRGLPVDLPRSSSASLEKEIILSVTVQAGEGGERLVFVDDQQVGLDGLSRVLSEKAALIPETEGAEPGVLLFADRSIEYQFLFDVLDRIHQAGLTRISLQADVDQ